MNLQLGLLLIMVSIPANLKGSYRKAEALVNRVMKINSGARINYFYRVIDAINT